MGEGRWAFRCAVESPGKVGGGGWGCSIGVSDTGSVGAFVPSVPQYSQNLCQTVRVRGNPCKHRAGLAWGRGSASAPGGGISCKVCGMLHLLHGMRAGNATTGISPGHCQGAWSGTCQSAVSFLSRDFGKSRSLPDPSQTGPCHARSIRKHPPVGKDVGDFKLAFEVARALRAHRHGDAHRLLELVQHFDSWMGACDVKLQRRLEVG